jgi:small subunit ribosomal protein S10
MKLCSIIIQSKSQKPIKDFISFLIASVKALNITIVSKQIQKKAKKKVITILKSPHINKKAQEQFETRYFSKQLAVYSTQSFKHMVFLKKIKSGIFPDVKVKLKFITHRKNVGKLRAKILDPCNFKMKILDNPITQLGKRSHVYISDIHQKGLYKIKLYIKTLEIYGELVRSCLFR